MAVRKQASGKWLCECYPHGHEGKRVRKQFATKGEAVAFERFTMEQAENKPWTAEKRDTRKLSDLIDVWYRAHGITLNDGEGRKSILDCAAASLGDRWEPTSPPVIFPSTVKSGSMAKYPTMAVRQKSARPPLTVNCRTFGRCSTNWHGWVNGIQRTR